MLFAGQINPVIEIACIVLVTLFLAGTAVWFFRNYQRRARTSLERAYMGINVHQVPQPGDVVVTYHTYYGFLAWFTQTTHHVMLPPDEARTLLKRLLRFNLKWSLPTYGAVFVPPLAILNYFVQRRSIARQEKTGEIAVPGHPSDM